MKTLIILFLILIVIIVVFAIRNSIRYRVEIEQKKYRDEENKYYRQRREEWLIQDATRREDQYKTLIKKMSNPSNIFRLPTDQELSSQYLMVNEKTEQILIKQKIYSFSEILDYELYDNQVVVEHRSTQRIVTTTKTNTGDVIGRTVVGGLLFGGVGAVVGGVTAERNSVSTLSAGDTTKAISHDFTIIITVNKTSDSLLKIQLHEDKNLADEICALLSVIITRNNNATASNSLNY